MRKRNFICKNIFEKRTYYLIYLAKEQGILRELIPNFKSRQQGYITNLNDIINNYNNLPKDWSIKRIKSIITYDYDDLVYDMTVKDNPTFVAGTNILVHNSTRRESVMNPKPFISSINSGVSDFKAIILDLMRLIYNKNKEGHPKLFTDINKLTVASSPLKINIEQILDQVRSGFVYGTVSIPTYQEALGLDPETERHRMQKEWDKGYRELFYPHLIQNREDIPDPNLDVKVPPLTKKQVEKQNEKTKQPKHMMKAEYTDDDFEFATLITCPKCNQEYIFEDLREAGMGYCKCPNCNEVLTQDLCEKARIDVTKNYIRIRQRELNEFESNSFRIIILSKDQGIKAVIGRLKGETTTTVQSYLFLKEKWSKEDAIKWVKEHGGKAVADVENNLIVAPYQNVEELLQKHPSMKKYPTEALKVFIEVFNKSLPKGEDYAYPVAWAAMKRWLKKHGYKKANNEWVKE